MVHSTIAVHPQCKGQDKAAKKQIVDILTKQQLKEAKGKLMKPLVSYGPIYLTIYKVSSGEMRFRLASL